MKNVLYIFRSTNKQSSCITSPSPWERAGVRSKQLLFLFFYALWANAANAQDADKQAYYGAKAQLEDMLNGKEKPSYEAAIFAIENAWYGNQIRIADFDSAMDFHVHNVQRLYKANYNEAAIKEQPSLLHSKEQLLAQYKKALTNWAIYTYITQPTLYADSSTFFVHHKYNYSYADPMASNDWANTQVINLNNSKQGNCFALASLFKILADRLQSNAQLCTAPWHIYIAHEDEKGTMYNVELGSKYFPGTGMISAITYSTDQAIENNIAQRTLTPMQQVALALVYLAKGYEHKFGNHTDSFLLQCATTALQQDPTNLNALLLQAEWLENKLSTQSKDIALLQKQADFVQYQKLLAKLYQLGYREMPLEMKNTILKQYQQAKSESKTPTLSFAKNGTPNASLSWGIYDERHSHKATERYGNTIFNTRTQKITAFATEQNLYNNYNFDPVVFAMNVDPMANKYPGHSPYSAFAGNPIIFTDHKGAYVEGMDGKPVTYVMLMGQIVWSANASEATQRIGRAMIKTETGREQFAKMQNTEYPIGVKLNRPGDWNFGRTDPVWDKDQNGKDIIKRVDMYVNVNSMNLWKNGADRFVKENKLTKVDIKKSITEYKDGEGKQWFQDYYLMAYGQFEDAVGTTGSHEAEHATNPQNLIDHKSNTDNKNKQGYIPKDVEAVPNQIESKELDSRIK